MQLPPRNRLRFGRRIPVSVVDGKDKSVRIQIGMTSKSPRKSRKADKPAVVIPTPKITVGAKVDDDVERPVSYVKEQYYTKSHTESGSRIATPFDQYDLTQQDQEWLAGYLADHPSNLNEDLMEGLVDLFEKQAYRKTTSYNCSYVFPVQDAIALVHGFEIDLDAAVIEHVYNYWIGRRKSIGKALIRKFQDTPSFDDPSPNIAFRPRERERRTSTRNTRKNDVTAFKKLEHLREDLGTVQEMVDLVRVREDRKRDAVLLDTESFDFELEQRKHMKQVPGDAQLVSSLPRSDFEKDMKVRPAKKVFKKKIVKKLDAEKPRVLNITFETKPVLSTRIEELVDAATDVGMETVTPSLEADALFYGRIARDVRDNDVEAVLGKKRRKFKRSHILSFQEEAERFLKQKQDTLRPSGVVFDLVPGRPKLYH